MSASILGVDLGGTHVRAGKVRDGHIERSAARRISSQAAADVVLGEVFATIDEVIGTDVAGIGFCVPSVVDVEQGVVYTVENIPSWTEVPLKAELEKRYRLPSFVNNDANAFAVGELHFGKGRGYRNLVGVIVGTGLGAGIIVEGHLYSGSNCGAGELGNIAYRGSTIERWCSGSFLARESGLDGEEVYARATGGDAKARALFASLGETLGDALLIALYAYDPQIVVLGGSVSRAHSLFEEPMRRRLETHAFPHALERTEIVFSDMKDVSLLGAAAIYLDSHA